MQTLGRITMMLSMLAGLTASIVTATLMWDTLPMMGAAVPPIDPEPDLRRLLDMLW